MQQGARLLVPLLHHAALGAVGGLDGQDVVADALPQVAAAAAPHRRQGHPRHIAEPRVVLPHPRHLLRAALLCAQDSQPQGSASHDNIIS